MKTASWVIVNKKTGNAIYETFSEKYAAAINLEKYSVVPVLEWLQGLNKKSA